MMQTKIRTRDGRFKTLRVSHHMHISRIKDNLKYIKNDCSHGKKAQPAGMKNDKIASHRCNEKNFTLLPITRVRVCVRVFNVTLLRGIHF